MNRRNAQQIHSTIYNDTKLALIKHSNINDNVAAILSTTDQFFSHCLDEVSKAAVDGDGDSMWENMDEMFCDMLDNICDFCYDNDIEWEQESCTYDMAEFLKVKWKDLDWYVELGCEE